MSDKKTAPKKPTAKKKKSAAKVDTTIAPDLQAVDPKLLERLVCPKTGGTLTYDRDAGELISKKAKLAYSIRGGVPIMLPDEARKL